MELTELFEQLDDDELLSLNWSNQGDILLDQAICLEMMGRGMLLFNSYASVIVLCIISKIIIDMIKEGKIGTD